MKAVHRELLRECPSGFTIGAYSHRPGGHLFVLRPDGQPLRDSNGVPVRVCSSPSSPRSVNESRARIRRALRDA